MAKYCVFGGFGFIGKYVVQQLREQGDEVLVVSQKKREVEGYSEWSNLDYPKLKKLMTGVEGVVNLAYSSTPKTSFDDPIADIRDNLPFTINFLECMSLFPLKKIVMISTGGAIYGNTNENPTTEKAETNPISPYGITKLAVEKYAHMYFKHKNLPIVSLRPGNAYGIGQHPFAGQGFIATATFSILENKMINIFGKEGTIRDYIHVSDVAKGIIAALKHGRIGETYNIGTGIGASNKDLLELLFRLAQKDGFTPPSVSFLNSRPFDVKENVLDSSKLYNDAGWKPQVNLPDGIKEYWQHSLSSQYHKDLNRVKWGNVTNL